MRPQGAFTRPAWQTRRMPILPERNCSLLVRTDFSSDYAWQQVADEATRENEDGFRAYAEPVSDPAFDFRFFRGLARADQKFNAIVERVK